MKPCDELDLGQTIQNIKTCQSYFYIRLTTTYSKFISSPIHFLNYRAETPRHTDRHTDSHEYPKVAFTENATLTSCMFSKKVPMLIFAFLSLTALDLCLRIPDFSLFYFCRRALVLVFCYNRISCAYAHTQFFCC